MILAAAGTAWLVAPSSPAEAAATDGTTLEASFEHQIQPFLKQHCMQCHNEDTSMSGIRVDQLDGRMEDRRLRLWSAVRRRIEKGTMPPAGMPQPTAEERRKMVEWISGAIEVARLRPAPKNGIVRRLTVAQYGNTLQELLGLEDDLTDILPPDAVSEDGFVNNTATLELSPLLMESYFEIAEKGLSRAIVNPDEKPRIQNFKVDLGASINPAPLQEELILGANSMLLPNADYVVEELVAKKSFSFDPFMMKTNYRFIEGYQGNGTVRGWRDFDSIYHAVFADMRGSRGYPKGAAYKTVPEGLLLRPAIPNDELFGADGTFGHSANFKISLRELPDDGRFRVTVTAAKYDDGLLLDPSDEPQDQDARRQLVADKLSSPQTVNIREPGIYQVDVHEQPRGELPVPDASRLSDGLAAAFDLNQIDADQVEGEATLIDSPFGKAASFDGDGDGVFFPHQDEMNVGREDFTVAAWIRPARLRNSVVAAFGVREGAPGWQLQTAGNKGAIRFTIKGADADAESVTSPAGVLRTDAWQHVAVVVRRGDSERTRLYVNGYAVAKGEFSAADLDNSETPLRLGRISYNNHFKGDLDEVRIYKRALAESELQALIEPGRELAIPPAETPQNIEFSLGGRPFSGELKQPAYVALQLDAGPLEVQVSGDGVRPLDRVVVTRLDDDDPVVERFLAFQQRVPRLGVHMGFRRDCGSTFAPVGAPQKVPGTNLTRFAFEGAINNYPSPSVEKNNVNYLAGVREIGVRSEYTDGRDMPRLVVRSVEFEGPYYETWPPKSHTAIFRESNRKSDTSAYAREIIGDFAERAYRRPLDTEEENALVSVFENSLESGNTFQQSIKDALQVTLTSPQFLFLVEASSTPEPEPIDDYELASKLSYFLWNGPPDQPTLDLAAAGTLRDHLDSEVGRMVQDERFARFTEQFGSQWLSLEKFDVVEPDRTKFSRLTRDARKHLRQEPIESFKYLIRANEPVSNLIQSKYIVANEAVAGYYDLGDKTESGFDYVPVVHGRPELGGLLTQVALMAGLSDGRESNPVKRGAWVARKIVAEPPDPPPPNVPDLGADTEGLSLRKRLEQHRNLPGCNECHLKIDPWGIALQEFDAGGRLKAEPADAVSTLPDGTQIEGANELKRYLAEDRVDQIAYSVLKHLLVYANGRSLTYNEQHLLKEDAVQLRAGGYRMQNMIRYVVNSEFFLEK